MVPMGSDLWPVVLGGALSVGGGLAGSVILRRWDIEREKRQQKGELIGAIRAVRQELTSNTVLLDKATDLLSVISIKLDDTIFRSVRLLLARELPNDLSNEVARAYGIWFWTAAAKVDALRRREAATEEAMKAIGAAAAQMHNANQRLQEFLRKTLKEKE